MNNNNHLVFARKYRPQKFSEVVGQEHIVRILEQAIAKKNIAHAYLLSGPRGTGKTTIARILAHELECAPEDIIEIDAASSRGIDEARALREAVRFLPLRSPKKVYIIDEVHMLTREAFNALLKTLEEPPEHVVFVLATTELQKVPDTIISRTQHFSFHKIAIPDIVRELARIAKLEKFEIADDALKIIAFFADGALRDAENMLLQVRNGGGTSRSITEETVRLMLGAPQEEHMEKILSHAFAGEITPMLTIFDASLAEGQDPEMLGKLLLRNVRALYFLALDQNTKTLLAEEFSSDEIKKFLGTLSVVQEKRKPLAPYLERAVLVLLEALRTSTDDFLPQLPLELALVKIATS